MTMNERHPSRKVGTKNRESAEAALVEHFTAERILRSDYDDKYRQIIAAQTVDDLSKIFDGLPDPHPDLTPDNTSTEDDDQRGFAWNTQVVAFATLWIGVPVTIGIWITTGQWWWPVIAVVAAAFLFWAGHRIGKTPND